MMLILALMLAAASATAPSGGSGRGAKVNQTAINQQVEAALNALNMRLTPLGVDSFGKHFTPDYVAKQTREDALKLQMARFRGQIGTALAEGTDEQLMMCPLDHVSYAAATAVIRELRELGWNADWIRSRERCPGRGGFAYVRRQKPTAAAASAAATSTITASAATDVEEEEV